MTRKESEKVRDEGILPSPQHFRLLAASVGMLLSDGDPHSLYFGEFRDARGFAPPTSILQRLAYACPPLVAVQVAPERILYQLRLDAALPAGALTRSLHQLVVYPRFGLLHSRDNMLPSDKG